MAPVNQRAKKETQVKSVEVSAEMFEQMVSNAVQRALELERDQKSVTNIYTRTTSIEEQDIARENIYAGGNPGLNPKNDPTKHILETVVTALNNAIPTHGDFSTLSITQ